MNATALLPSAVPASRSRLARARGAALTGGGESTAPAKNAPATPAGVSPYEHQAHHRSGSTMPAMLTTTASVLVVDGVTKAFSSGPPWHRRKSEVLRGASLGLTVAWVLRRLLGSAE